jgi:hypothetical protein
LAGEGFEEAYELMLLKIQALGVWKRSRAKVTPVMYALPSFRSRCRAGAPRSFARRRAALGQMR